MPTYQVIGVYENTETDLTWSMSNKVVATDVAAAFAQFDAWNTAYMGVCSAMVVPAGVSISDIDVYRDMTLYEKGDMTTQIGQTAGRSAPDANGAMFTFYGNATNQGQSHVLFHGIATAYVTSDEINTAHAAFAALRLANLAYYTQYRKVPSPKEGLPYVDPPQFWYRGLWAKTLHVRRLGDPLDRNGQRRRYRRKKAA